VEAGRRRQRTILRFLDLGGEPRTVTIHTPLLSISKIVATDAVERDQNPIVPEDEHTFKIAVRAHQILTVRLLLLNFKRVAGPIGLYLYNSSICAQSA
jgi:hypothetical protein